MKSIFLITSSVFVASYAALSLHQRGIDQQRLNALYNQCIESNQKSIDLLKRVALSPVEPEVLDISRVEPWCHEYAQKEFEGKTLQNPSL
jgi:hypothetical protein